MAPITCYNLCFNNCLFLTKIKVVKTDFLNLILHFAEAHNFFFLTRMRTYDGFTLAVSLVKNHDFVTALYSDADHRNVMDSQSVMLELVPGDIVYLALGPSSQYAYYSDKNKLSTFSGFLLYKKS